MADFRADVTADISQAIASISQISSQIQALSKNKVTIDVDFNVNSTNLNNVLNQLNNQAQGAGANFGKNYANAVNSSLGNIKVDDIANKVQNLQTALGKMNFNTGQIDNITKEFENMNMTVTKVTSTMKENGNIQLSVSGIDQMGRAVTVMKEFDDAGKSVEKGSTKVTESVKQVSSSMQALTNLKASTLSNNITTWMNNNAKAAQAYGTQLQALQQKLSSGNLDASGLRQASAEFANIKSAANAAGLTTNTFATSLKNTVLQVAGLSSAVMVINKVMSAFKEGCQAVIELDNALTNISYTMNLTGSELQDIGTQALSMAEDLSTSATTVLQAVQLYANANETSSSILNKSKAAVMLSNVTGMTGTESAQTLQSVMNQFDLTEDDLMSISDTIQAVSQNMSYDFASGIKEIASGIEASGSVAKNAGLDLQEYSSMLGLVVEKTGQSGSTIGRAFSTIFQRITKASKTSGTLEEDISKAETSLRSAGIEIRSDGENFRDINDILSDLAEKWDTLDDVTKSNISYNVAGTRQTNILKQLMTYYSEYEDLVNKANDSSGTTLENQDKYASSLTGKLNELSAVWSTIANQTIDSGMISGFLDMGIAVSELIEKFGLLKTAITALGVIRGFAFFSNFDSALIGISATLDSALTGISATLASVVSGVGDFVAGMQLAGEVVMAFLAANPIVGWAALAGVAIAGTVFAVDSLTESFDEACDSADNARDKMSEAQESLDDVKNQKDSLKLELESLAQKYNIEFDDNDEPQEIIDKLKEIQSLGQMQVGDGFDLSSLEAQNAALEAQLAIKQKLYNDSQQQAGEASVNALTKEYEYETGGYVTDDYGRVVEAETKTGNIVSETYDKREQLTGVESELATLYEQQADMVEKGQDTHAKWYQNETEYDKLEKQIASKEAERKQLTSDIDENLETISENYSSLLDENGEVLPGCADAKAAVDNLYASIMNAEDAEQSASSTTEETASATEEAVSAVEKYTTVLEDAQTAQTNLQSAIKDSNSATGMTTDDINNVASAFSSLKDYDPELLFERTANGIRLNSEALKYYNQELESQTKQGYIKAILKKQEELNEAQSHGASDEVISGIEDEITQLQYLAAQYDGLTSSYNKYVEATSSANNRDSFEDIASGYESVGKLIEQGWTTDDSVTTYLDLLLGTDRIQDSQQAYAQLSQTIDDTTHSLKDYFTTDESGNLTSQGAWEFVDDIATKLGDDYVKIGEDGSYALDLTGDKLQTVANSFGTTTEFVELLGRALADAGMDVTFDSDSVQDYNEKMSELAESANDAHEALKELQDSSESNALSDIDLNYDSASMSIDEISDKIDELSNKRAEIDVDTEEGQAQVDALDAEIESLSNQKIMLEIGAQLEGGTTVGELLDLSDSELQETLHINTDEVDTARAQLESLATSDVEVPVTVQLADEQFQALTGTTATTVNVTPVVTSQPTFDDATVNVTATCTTPPTIPDATGTANMELGESPTEVPDVDGTANYSMGDYPTSAPTIYGTASYSASFNFSLSAPTIYGTAIYTKTTQASGTMTAHADGTAYNTLNMKRISPSHARGDVTLQNNEQALVNEIGQESIVRDGVWYMLPAYPHIENLKKGDIVFSAQQTADLLNHGKANNYARALANGTLNAYGLTGKGNNPWRSSSSSSSSSGSSSSSSSSSYSSASSNSSYTSASTSNSSTSSSSSSSSSDEFEEQMDYIEIALNRINEAIERVKTTAESAFKTLSKKNTAAADEITLMTKQISLQEQAYQRYMKEANALGLSSTYVNKIQNGSIELETITDEDLHNKIQDYKDLYEKAIEAKDEVAKLNEEIAELYSDMFDNISKDYKNKLSIIEHLTNTYQSGLDQLEAAGMMGSTSYYQYLIDAKNESISIMESELADLQASFKKAMSSGEIEKYSDEWYEMQEAINDVRESLDDSTESLLKYESEMRKLNWDYFEYAEDRISDVTNEAEFLIELLESSDLYNDDGSLSNNGLASLGLRGERYNLYLAQADDYAKMVSELNAEIAENPLNTELVKQRDEYLELQQKSIKNALDEKKSITSLIEDGYDKQIDALNDLIDSYEDSLDSAKELYDYQKNIKKQTAEIASIQKQLAAYQNDTSEETKAKVQKLQVDLSDAMDELEEDQYDQYVKDQKKLLDSLAEDYKTILNERLDNVDSLISDCIDSINANSSDIADAIYSIADSFGYSISASGQSILNNGGYSTGLISNYGTSSSGTSVAQEVSSIHSYVDSLKSAANAEASSVKASEESAAKTTGSYSNYSPYGKVSAVGSTLSRGSTGKEVKALQYALNQLGFGNEGTTGLDGDFGVNTEKAVKNFQSAMGIQVDGYVGSETKGMFKLNGYKNGTLSAPGGLAWSQENGSELIVKPTANSILTRLDSGDGVIPHDATANLMAMAKDPTAFINSAVQSGLSLGAPIGSVSSVGDINISIPIDHVDDYNDLVDKMKNDGTFEKMIQSMTVDRLSGGSKLAKYKYNFK